MGLAARGLAYAPRSIIPLAIRVGTSDYSCAEPSANGLGEVATAAGVTSSFRIARFRTRRASFCFRNLPKRALSPF
jgi:hypothetical protein